MLTWRIAVLFMVGATLFALGSFPGYGEVVGAAAVGVTFFVGSVFFTSAAYSQFLQVINTTDEPAARRRFWAWYPGDRLYWAGLVQLGGTILFNVNTHRAMWDNLSVQEIDRLVWAPGFVGSIAFLVASHLAWLATCGRFWCARPDDVDWWVAASNYAGSIFFMLSALGAFVLPTTGEMLNVRLVNSATFLGAVCFLIGAYLLLEPAARRSPAR